MTSNNLFDEILSLQSTKQSVKQQRIVEAAIRLFAEKGYSNTSTAEIAKAAEVSEASIFKKYGTKDNLLLFLIVPYIKEFFSSRANEAIGQVLNHAYPTFEEFLRDFLKNRIRFIMENKEIFQVLIKEIIYKEELKCELLPYFSKVVEPKMTTFLAQYTERGELIDIPVDRLLRLLFSFFFGFFASRFVLLNTKTINDEEIEDAVHFIMNGIQSSSSGS